MSVCLSTPKIIKLYKTLQQNLSSQDKTLKTVCFTTQPSTQASIFESLQASLQEQTFLNTQRFVDHILNVGVSIEKMMTNINIFIHETP